MQMFKINSGKLKAVGFDAQTRTLCVELEDGSILDYANVGESTWRNFKNSGSQWSFYRNNIEEEYTAQRAANKPSVDKNPLDDLFK